MTQKGKRMVFGIEENHPGLRHALTGYTLHFSETLMAVAGKDGKSFLVEDAGQMWKLCRVLEVEPMEEPGFKYSQIKKCDFENTIDFKKP